MIPFISIGIWVVTITADLITDTRMKVNHTRGALLRIPSFTAMFLLSGWKWWPLFAFAYWAVFNLGWNLLKKLKPFRKGTTSFLDRNTPVWLPWLLLILSIIYLAYGKQL